MGLLILVGSLLWGGEGAWARDTTAREKKQLERELKQERSEQARQALENQKFVLEADRLTMPRGYSFLLRGKNNFVMFNEDTGTVQYTLDHAAAGQSGPGNRTFSGKLDEVTHWTKANGEQVYRYVLSGGLDGVIDLVLFPGDNFARAVVGGENRTVFWGRVVSLEESEAYRRETQFPVRLGPNPVLQYSADNMPHGYNY